MSAITLRMLNNTDNRSDQTGHTQNLHKYQSFSPPRALALIQLDIVFLQVIMNVLQVSAHTETTHQSRSMRNYKKNARTQSSEANHKGDTSICFPKFRFTTVNPTSPLRNSLGMSLFQPDPLSWVFINHSSFPLSWSFLPKGQDHARTNLSQLTTPLGASRRHLAV